MNRSLLSQIETLVEKLSLAGQLQLLEQMSQIIRKSIERQSLWNEQFGMLMIDQEMQNEFARVNKEFTLTEADGLEIM